MKKKYLNKKEIIFIDFDGTIKDSDKIKGKTFIEIFGNKLNNSIKKKIKEHHHNNLGVSRYLKIPMYLKWNSISSTKININKYNKKFSKIIVKKVCDSKWIAGAKYFIKSNKKKKIILVTATPVEEIKLILKKLKIIKYFYKIFGSPLNKSEIVKKTIKKNNFKKKYCIYFGNSYSDYIAAQTNKILYINIGNIKNFKKKYNKIKNFKSLN